MNPLLTIRGTLAVGVLLSVLIMAVYRDGHTSTAEWFVWLHVLSGITWIGLLYYFNFVQVPGVSRALAEAGDGGPGAAAINKYIAPTALLWFRMASVVTWLSGATMLWRYGELDDAFLLRGDAVPIGVGAWLGTIMLFNVWVLIWPNQKKILGLDGKTHDADTITKAKKVALLASRINTALSIPMLLAMTAWSHGGFPF